MYLGHSGNASLFYLDVFQANSALYLERWGKGHVLYLGHSGTLFFCT